MLEVIYISPSCKQAVNFIDDLSIKLKQHGIGGFDIDHRNAQIKSDKFIVSTACIGMSPRPSYYGVKYYIDEFSNGYIPPNCSFERLYEWVEHLKCRFRPDAKEISEEELIEILTEV